MLLDSPKAKIMFSISNIFQTQSLSNLRTYVVHLGEENVSTALEVILAVKH